MPNLVPGMLWTYFQNAVLVTIPVSLILLVWYRRAVSHEMDARSDVEREMEEIALDGSAASGLSSLPTDAVNPHRLVDATGSDTGSRLRLALIYAAAGAVASGVLTALFFFTMPGVDLAPLRVFVVWYAFCWPIVPSIAALLAISRYRALLWLLGYILAGAVVIWAWSAFNKAAFGRTDIVPYDNAKAFLTFLRGEAWLPCLIILVTGNRRLRSVSPLALAGLLVFSYSALVLNYAVVALMDVGSAREWLLRVAGANFRHLLFLLAALPVGLVCWWLLRWLGRAFDNKSFSDVQLVVDTWWLIVVFNAVVLLASDLGWGALAGLLAFVAFRIVVEAGVRLWGVARAEEQVHRLLLLRVFGFQRRTENLFDGIAQRWRFRGSVRLIAGTDLVSRLIDPGDFIRFVGGRLKRQFVQSSEDLSRNLSMLDDGRDPDGRFRVNKFFCHANTWRATLRALLERSDVVLMDLRGFSEQNRGCQFELQELAENSLLKRTVFVVDETTDSKLLEASLIETGRTVTSSAPDDPGRINVVHTKTQSAAEIREIYRVLQTCE